MDFRHLRYFVTIAKTGNISRAADALRVAQSALSRQIAELEAELGVTLLDRHAKGVTPTLAGQAFDRGASRTVSETIAALDRAQATAEGRRGRVVVGAMRFTIAHGFLGQLEEAVHREHPEVALEVQELDFREILDAVTNGEIDVAITAYDGDRPQLAAAPLWVETLDHAILPTGHPLTANARLTLPELGDLHFVYAQYSLPAPVVAHVIAALRASGLQSPILVLDAGLHDAHLAVAVGRGWTPVSRSLARTPPEGTTAIPLVGLDFRVPVSALWRGNEHRPVIRTVLETAYRLARRIPDHSVQSDPRLPAPARRRSARQRQAGTLPVALEIRHLRGLLGVTATQTIGRAAEQLGVTQQALSRQLRDLEHAIGFRLLDRSARGVTMTAAGNALAGDCPALLAGIDRLRREVTRARRGMEGHCVIGAVATVVTSEILTTLLTTCTARYPRLRLAIEEMPSPHQVAALLRGDIDLGLAHAYVELEDVKGVELHRIVEDRVQFALLSAAHPLAQQPELAPRDLADVPLLFMARAFHPKLYDRVMEGLRAIGLTPRIDSTHDGLHSVWALAAQGKGWCLAFKSQRQHPPAGTVAVPIAGLDLPWGIDTVSRETETNPAVRIVVGLLREAARQGVAARRVPRS